MFDSFFLSAWLNWFVKSRFYIGIWPLVFLGLVFLDLLSLLLSTFLLIFEGFKSLKFLSSLLHCLSFNNFFSLLFLQPLLYSFHFVLITNLDKSSAFNQVVCPYKLLCISRQEGVILFPFNLEFSLDTLELLFCLSLAQFNSLDMIFQILYLFILTCNKFFLHLL